MVGCSHWLIGSSKFSDVVPVYVFPMLHLCLQVKGKRIKGLHQWEFKKGMHQWEVNKGMHQCKILHLFCTSLIYSTVVKEHHRLAKLSRTTNVLQVHIFQDNPVTFNRKPCSCCLRFLPTTNAPAIADLCICCCVWPFCSCCRHSASFDCIASICSSAVLSSSFSACTQASACLAASDDRPYLLLRRSHQHWRILLLLSICRTSQIEAAESLSYTPMNTPMKLMGGRRYH